MGKSKPKIIKKHESNIYVCTREIIPYKSLNTSDKSFGDLDKGSTLSPYKHADILYYSLSKLWIAPAAIANIIYIDNFEKGVEKFPLVEQLYKEFDSWSNQINPFSYDDLSSMGTEKKVSGNKENTVMYDAHVITMPNIIPIPNKLQPQYLL